MKNIIRRIFISKIMRPNFMHIRQKISFKSAFEKFASVSGHLRSLRRHNLKKFFFLFLSDLYARLVENKNYISVTLYDINFQKDECCNCYKKIHKNIYRVKNYFSRFSNGDLSLSERFDFPPFPCNPMGILSLSFLKISH